ncbi:MAG: hypothetical protein KJ007_06005 [Burkholderiales bacterium]|nr:hypothetical protein [Burkholderiales bacterium]
MKKMIGTILTCLLLAACGSGLDGTYSDQSGVLSYRFESGGKVYAKSMGMESEFKYTVDGDKVKIEVPGGGNMIFTKAKDGSLMGPMGIALKKKP